MAEFMKTEEKVVNVDEPVIFENNTDSDFSISAAIVFRKSGLYDVSITKSDKISYAVICDKFPSPTVYFNTYDEAEHWARINQPNYRPYYIVKRSEHFEIVGGVK